MIMMMVFIVLSILFILAIVLSTKNWGAAHITALCLVYLLAFFFVVQLASVHALRRKFMTEVQNKEKQLESERQAGRELLQPSDPTQPGIDEMRARLMRLKSRRGRIYQANRTGFDATSKTVTLKTITVSLDAEGKQQAQEGPVGIENGAVVYAFRQSQSARAKRFVATSYVGQFKVTGVNGADVTMVPTMKFSDHANLDGYFNCFQDEMKKGGVWEIYDVMPIDDHRAFSSEELDFGKIADAIDAPFFGEIDPDNIKDAFELAYRSIVADKAERDARIAKMVELYGRDGTAAKPGDDAANIWTKVEMVKQSDPIEVDKVEKLDDKSEIFETATGRAIEADLLFGKAIRLPANQIAIFPKERAEELARDQIVNPKVDLFIRPLKDYRHHFHTMFRRLQSYQRGFVHVKAVNEKLTRAVTAVDNNTKYQEAQKSNLLADKKNELADLAELKRLQAELAKLEKALEARLTKVYLENRKLAKDLAEKSARLTAAAGVSATKDRSDNRVARK